MIEYIKGILAETSPQKAIIDVGGIGHGLLIPLSTYSKLPPISEEVLLYVSSVIREDSPPSLWFSHSRRARSF